MCPRLEQNLASNSSRGQLSRETFGLLAFTACGLLLAMAGRYSSHEQAGNVLAA